MVNMDNPNYFPLLLKLYIYGLHGYLLEVTFTAVWDFVVTGDWRLQGVSSIWSLPIYGTCGLALEILSRKLRTHHVPIYFRAFLYVLVIYLWEYTSGTLLSIFSACPWNYKDFTYNIGGLITLEYAPFWLITGLLAEKVLVQSLDHRFRWIGDKHDIVYSQSTNGFASTNGYMKSK